MFDIDDHLDSSTEDGQLKLFHFKQLNHLNSLRLGNCFTDLVLIVEDVEFFVHSEVLRAATDFFRNKVHYEMSIGQRKCRLDSISAPVFSTILNFIYTGLVCFSKDTISALYSAADFMCIPHLVEECRKWLLKKMLLYGNQDGELFQISVDLINVYQDEVLRSYVNPILSNQFSIFVADEKIGNLNFISQLGVENFGAILKENRILLRKNQSILMGLFYEKKVKELFAYCFPNVEYCLKQDDMTSQYFSHLSCIYVMGKHFAAYPRYDPSYADYKPEMITTCNDFPVERWTICGMTIYELPLWGKSKRMIAGVDIEYRDIWTGERKEFLCELNTTHGMKYPTHKFNLNEGETISSVKMYSGWLVDKISFSTNQNCEHVFFDENSGGGIRYIDRSMRHYPMDVNSRFNFRGFHGPVVHNRALALHGFAYNLIRTWESIVWANIYFIFSGLREEDTQVDDSSKYSLII